MDHRKRPPLRVPHFRIQGKLVLGFGLELALVAGVAMAGLLGLRSVNRSFQTAIDHGLKVERLASTMRSELLEARRNEGDFLLRWRSETFQSAYQNYVRANQQHVAQLRATASELQAEGQARGLTDRDSRAMEDLVALRPYVNVYAEDFQSAVALIGEQASRDARGEGRRRADGHLDADVEVAKKIAGFRSAAIVIEPLVADIARYGRENAAARIVAAEGASRNTDLVVSTIVATAIATGLGLAYVLGRQIRRPLERLVRTVEVVGTGDLTAQADVSSHDEIGMLAAAFNGMTLQLRGLVASLKERVTERERAEQAVRGSQRLLQSIIDTSTAVIYVKDLDGRYLLVNHRFEEIFHVARDSALLKTDQDLFPKDIADAYRAFDLRVLAAGKTLEAEEVALQDDGLHTYISIKCPMRGVDDKTYAVCGISTDITERKQMEEHRAAIAVEIARLYRESQKAIERRDEFLAIASHELRTPLTPMKLQLMQLQRALRNSGFEGMSDKLGTSLRQLDRLGRLVENLLDVASINTGQLTLRFESVDLSELVRRVTTEHQEVFSRSGCTLELTAPEAVVGRWDRHRIEQVIVALLSNATKYGAYGRIVVEVAAQGSLARVSVRDFGIGIAPDDQSRIFERFERAASARSYGGLGLGLYIARQIVLAHNGSIRVHSELGQGSTFVALLPLEPPGPRVCKPNSPPS